MPKTKFQNIVFTAMMVCVMVYGMDLYNAALAAGGLRTEMFVDVLKTMPLMVAIAFVVETLLCGRVAQKLMLRHFTPGKDKPIFIILAMAGFTLCQMCPIMSLAATLLYKNPGREVLAVWAQTVAFNFPMATCWQIFVAGPLVRRLFRAIFEHESHSERAVVSKNLSGGLTEG